jgi:hypothetical protein
MRDCPAADVSRWDAGLRNPRRGDETGHVQDPLYTVMQDSDSPRAIVRTLRLLPEPAEG